MVSKFFLINKSNLEGVNIIQPAIFAVQVALAELWKSLGVTPDAVVGHSMGEVAAAYSAGIFDLEEAVKIICLRSQLLRELKAEGGMLATELSPEQAEAIIKGKEKTISIAVINSPSSTVLSGYIDDLAAIVELLEEQNLFYRWVNVDVASHSPQVEPLYSKLVKALGVLQAKPPQIPIYSTVTGERADQLNFNASYWAENLVKPVLFHSTTEKLLADKHSVFIEIGPHPILLSSIKQTIGFNQPEIKLLPSMHREEPEEETLFRTLAELYIIGVRLNCKKLYPEKGKYVHLPPVSWNHQRYWLDATATPRGFDSSPHHQSGPPSFHPLLGNRIELAHSPSTYLWQSIFSIEKLPFLAEHKVEDEIVVPAAAYIEMALAAAQEAKLKPLYNLSDVYFSRKMVLPKDKEVFIQTILSPEEKERFSFKIFSRSGEMLSWENHVNAIFLEGSANEATDEFEERLSEVFKKEYSSKLSGEKFYHSLKMSGLSYGKTFQGIKNIWNKSRKAIAEVQLPSSLPLDLDPYQIHPALLDACLQAIAGISHDSPGNNLYLPWKCNTIQFFQRSFDLLWSYASLQTVLDSNNLIADIKIFNEKNQLLLKLTGFQLQKIDRRKLEEPSPKDLWLYRLNWQPHIRVDSVSEKNNDKKSWLIFADSEGVGMALAKALEQKGDLVSLLQAEEILAEGQDRVLGKISNFLESFPKPVDYILHLWGISIPPQSLNDFEKSDFLGCNGVLHIVQLLARQLSVSPQLYLVTRGAQSVSGSDLEPPEQSPLWGLGKVISFELPEFKCTRIDLDPKQSVAESASLLIQQITVEDKEDQIAFRAGNKYVPRLVPFELKLSSELVFHPNNTYLITGGWGALGLASANWMAKKGARHLVLIGRSKPSIPAMQVIREMESRGVNVMIAQADVSDPMQLDSVFKNIDDKMPSLKGVFHAAGLIDDGALLNLDALRMKKVMLPKVDGTWNLHVKTAGLDLEFFVLFSSAVSVLGSPGQGNYAAASAYLDAMAHYRQSLGLPAISINWGPWADVGLAAEATEKLQAQKASTQHLVKVIKMEQGLKMLELLLRDSRPQAAVLPFDLKNLLELFPKAAGMPFFEDVGGRENHAARLYARPNLRQPFVAPRNELERKMAALWQQTLHVDRVGIHDSFFELGGDSVLAAQILSLARKTYGISINPQEAFQAFTVERLAKLLEEEILKQIEEMSEEEAQKRLSE